MLTCCVCGEEWYEEDAPYNMVEDSSGNMMCAIHVPDGEYTAIVNIGPDRTSRIKILTPFTPEN